MGSFSNQICLFLINLTRFTRNSYSHFFNNVLLLYLIFYKCMKNKLNIKKYF